MAKVADENNGRTPQAIPPMVGQYRLLGLLGRGGSGVVCAAEDRSLGRRVAIKLIRCKPASGNTTSQLLREARMAGQVRHPNVISLYDAGTYAGGVFLVTELMDGPSLGSLASNRPLPWREATAVVLAACEGLMAIHACGIIHRDLKPANLLRTAEGAVKIADFGLACRFGSSTSAYRDGLAGTPHFMSPEQCRNEECDERADVYSLGATYCALLTGSTPYANSRPLEIMFAHCAAPTPDPNGRLRKLPRACAEIVARAMAKKRADRFDCALDMKKALRSVTFGEELGQS